MTVLEQSQADSCFGSAIKVYSRALHTVVIQWSLHTAGNRVEFTDPVRKQ